MVIEAPQISDSIQSSKPMTEFEPFNKTLNAIDDYLGVKSKFKIKVRSDLPIGAGLGSSSATSVSFVKAVTSALEHDLKRDEILELASVFEKHVHGNPSGIDVRVSNDGGLVLYSKSTGSTSLSFNESLSLIVSYSGETRNTGAMISHVEKFRDSNPYTFQAMVNSSSNFVNLAVDCIKTKNLNLLGSIMQFHNSSLSLLGLSTPKIDIMIDSVLKYGSLGAKITGAGGGGCIIVLPEPTQEDQIINTLSKVSDESFITTIPQKGVKLWKKIG
tara:strand:- start:148 stop:966 length:819 start_codon:yes stop_codon:yes gene_type:complete